MYFKLQSSAQIPLDEGALVEIPVGGTRKATVSLRPVGHEDLAADHPRFTSICTATGQWQTSEGNQAVFDSLWNNQPPPGWDDVEGGEQFVTADGRLKAGVVPIDKLPQGFQQFCHAVRSELEDLSRHAVGLARWRLEMPGPHESIRPGPMEWSLDGTSWKATPGRFTVEAGWTFCFWPAPSWLGPEVAKLMADGLTEPLGHELLREAKYFRHSHRRSSLLTGIAAAEVGVKGCIIDLEPGSSWLVENLPSPPLVKMLQGYLPRLPVRQKIQGKVVPPPEDVCKVLEKGVQIRNRVTHIGHAGPSAETLEDVLLAVEDTLWILDYYRGYQWAIGYVRTDTRSKMEEAASKMAG